MEQNSNPMMSDNIDQLATALSAFQAEVEQPKLEREVIVKSKSTGKSFTFKYADLSACVKAAAPVMKVHGLAVSQIIMQGKLTTILAHKSGQWLKSEVQLPAPTTDFQAYGSAITYVKRYSYCAILGIVADTDDDANAACGNDASFTAKKNKTFGGGDDLLIEEALSDVRGVTNLEGLTAVFNKWKQIAPELCKKGALLHNEIAIKGTELKSKTA